jgi:hypothetical protein
MRRIAIIASILLLATACDKPSADPAADAAAAALPDTDLSGDPTILFTVFGERTAPRIAPIAVARGRVLESLRLSPDGWQRFDSVYFAPGKKYSVYRNGALAGEVEIARGMFDADSGVLYTVPGCRNVIPQAVGRLRGSIPLEESVELLGASALLTQPVDRRALPRYAEAEGRSLANAVAAGANIGNEDLANLNFHARYLRTGIPPLGRTLLASFVDPQAGDLGPGAGETAMILALAEDSSGVMKPSYQHAVSGDARSVESQRIVNYVDLDGDGVTELFLEAWKYAGVPSIAALSYVEGKWREGFRVELNWCLSAAP